MSMFQNGRVIVQDFEAFSLGKNNVRASRGFEMFTYTREQLEDQWKKNKKNHGWVDLETLEVHKPNGETIPYNSDVRMFDLIWDRGQYKPTSGNGRNGIRYQPMATHFK